ncbi:MAG: tetratricopeptide repeat protein, partial [Ignavibacteriae bacterium]|nr:tetratricopeptide repeat protein [Ignavibacteriota bacterium]
EQLQGSEINHRTDIWSFGVVFYEMLAGRLPFTSDLQPTIVFSILTKDPVPLSSQFPNIPPALDQIVEKCLEKDPAKRFQSANDIIRSIRHSAPEKTAIEKSTAWSRRWWIAAVIGILLLAYLFSPSNTTKEEIPSIAVLYLKNLGPAADEPLSWGITQDLIVDLARAGWIRVSPMNDILQLRDAQVSLEEISQRLNVGHILEGSILRQDSIFKISAQLIDVKSKRTLWADRPQLRSSEIAKLQTDMALSILRALQVTTSKQTEKELSTKRSENPEAFEYYLRAKYTYDHKQSKEDVAVAQGLYSRAIQLDSTMTAARIGLAEISTHSGEYEKAEHIYEAALVVARARGERLTEAACLRGIGLTKWHRGKYTEAIGFYSDALPITRELGDRFGEARILNNFGLVYWNQAAYRKALEYYNESLQLRQEIGDLQGQAQTLGNMGLVYWDQYDYKRALEHYNRALKIDEEIGDQSQQGNTLNNIGLLYSNQGDYQNALSFYDRSLKISQALGDHKSEGQTLNNIGNIYEDYGDYPTALEYYTKAAKIVEGLNDRVDLATALNNMGLVHTEIGQFSQALTFLSRSLKINREIGAKENEGITLQSLGKYYLLQNDVSRAREFFEQAGMIASELKDTLGQIVEQSFLGLVMIKIRKESEAQVLLPKIEGLLTAYVTSRDSDLLSWGAYWNISQVHSALGNQDASRRYLEKAYNLVTAQAGKISDVKFRESFRSNVRTNREIIEAWNKNKLATW